MIRPSRLQRRLDAALAPVVESIDELADALDTYRCEAVDNATHHMVDAEQRVTAATAQAGERVAHAERRAADAIAAVHAELAKKTSGQWIDHLKQLTAERDHAQRVADSAIRDHDELAGEVEHLRAEVARLTIERDEARRQHDEARAKAHELRNYRDIASHYIDRCDVLTGAARAVLPDLADALPHRPKGGSRTRARRRLEALAALVEPTDST